MPSVGERLRLHERGQSATGEQGDPDAARLLASLLGLPTSMVEPIWRIWWDTVR
jgi:hypothetical protein